MYTMTDSGTLLAQYARDGSESAFGELVARYINLVYSTALRLVNGDAHMAEDVTQEVFLALARRANRLGNHPLLGGWLHQHTRFVAAKILRGERRRRRRERKAAEMNQLEEGSEDCLARISPILDLAISRLGTADRVAILLRFFEQREFRSIGQALGTTEEAARKRVDRALDKLHEFLTRNGVTVPASGLGTVLAAGAVMGAPLHLAGSVTGTALAGTTVSGTTLTLAKLVTMTKVKMGVVGALVVVGAATFVAKQEVVIKNLRADLSQRRADTGVDPSSKSTSLNNQPRFDWRQVESSDYRTYIQNLRAIGCPEKTIQDIVVADVNALFDSREKNDLVLTNLIAYWRSDGTALGKVVREQMVKRHHEFENARTTVLKQLLGGSAPMEERPAKITDYDVKLSLLNFIPEEQRSNVLDDIKQFDDIYDAKFKPLVTDGRWDNKAREDYKQFWRNRETNLVQILGPDMAEKYAMRESPLANYLRFNFRGIDFSETEFQDLFRFSSQFELLLDPLAYDFGDGRQKDSVQAAQLAVYNRMAELVGPDRVANRTYSEAERRARSNYGFQN